MQTLKKRMRRDYHRLRRLDRKHLRENLHKRIWRIGRKKSGKEEEA